MNQQLLDFFNGLKSCEHHCWCAYAEDDPLITSPGLANIVRLMKVTPHEHGPGPNGCSGYLIETGRMRVQ